MKKLAIVSLPELFAVCRLGPDEPIPSWLPSCEFWSITRTEEELSVVAPEGAVPGTWQAERGWRCLKVQGPLDFGLTGVLSSLSVPLAAAGISVFALSTYETDYLFVRAVDLEKAKSVLTAAHHVLLEYPRLIDCWEKEYRPAVNPKGEE
jgi:hypothetical protein